MKLSVENLNLAKNVVELMNEKGAKQLRVSGSHGPEMSRLLRDCIREAK